MVWGLCVSLIAGIVRSIPLFVFVFISLVVIWHRRRASIRTLPVVMIASVAFFGYGWLDTASCYRRSALFRARASDSADVTLRGWVASYPRHREGTSQCTLRSNTGGVLVDIGLSAAAFDLGYGDSLLVCGRLIETAANDSARAADTARSLRSHSLAAYVRAPARGITRLDGHNGAWIARNVLWPVHSRLRNEMVRYLGVRSGLALALVLGEKENLSKNEKRAFSRLGISHLFALSGLHLGLILGIVLLLLAPFGRWRLILVCCSLSLYMGVVGDVVSLHRAYAMALIGCLAKHLQRPIDPMSMLARALLVLLVLRPGAFHFVAFQFSFVATFAVLLSIRRMRNIRRRGVLRRLAGYIRASLTVSAYAQLFIFPLALHYFGEASMLTPVTTIVFLPLVFSLLIAAGSCCVACLASPVAGELAYRCLGTFSGFFSRVLEASSSIAPPPLRVQPPSLCIYCLGLAVCFGGGAAAWKKAVGVALIGISFLWSGLSA